MTNTISPAIADNAFLQAAANRRSIYALDKHTAVSNEVIVATIKKAVELAPSAFNSQSARAIVLFAAEHEKLWGEAGIAEKAIRAVLPAGQSFEGTAQKLASFNAAAGTVLFFEDTDIVTNLQKQFPLYADNFPVWSEQSSGIAQYAVWTALSEIGLGASLQHYNPLIDEGIQTAFALPANWKLRAQMPFGNISAPAGEKEVQPIDERVRVFG
ncbi:MAG: nitroreductase family protein [Sporolactobacillus sp.]